jgi:TonB family protein
MTDLARTANPVITTPSAVAATCGWAVQDEFAAMRARFQRALAVSVGAHVLLAAALLLVEGARPRLPEIIEVTWLEPVASAPEPVVPVPMAEPEAKPLEEPARARVPVPADARPQPAPGQAAAAAAPANARPLERRAVPAASRHELATALPVAPPSASARAALASAPDPGAGLARAAAATMMPLGERGRPVTLARGPESGGAALALTRGPAGPGSQATLAAAAPPVPGVENGGGNGPATSATTRPSPAVAAAAAEAGDILLEGPAAGREVRHRVLPAYPAWAQRQAVEAVVRLRFAVLPDGQVREDVAVERTGGFRDFDESAVAALRGWRFAPLAGGDAAGHWGTITFRFRLRG